MNENREDWLGIISIVAIITVGICYCAYLVLIKPAGMSEGHKAADARYRFCLTSLGAVHNLQDTNYNFDPRECEGALGEYQLNKTSN